MDGNQMRMAASEWRWLLFAHVMKMTKFTYNTLLMDLCGYLK